jgi:hypothetical protein
VGLGVKWSAALRTPKSRLNDTSVSKLSELILDQLQKDKETSNSLDNTTEYQLTTAVNRNDGGIHQSAIEVQSAV